jgi:hypothetical protein
MARTLVGVLVVMLAVTATAGAGIPDPDNSQLTLAAPVGMATCPDGDGPAYQYITVTAKTSLAAPIQGIPYNSFFFVVTGGDVTISAVDAESDVNGEIRFEMTGDESLLLLDPVFLNIEAQIYTVVLSDNENMECNTFDIQNVGDGVGLEDFALFAGDYGGTAKRSDFNWDGGVGLEDFAFFAAHYGHGVAP